MLPCGALVPLLNRKIKFVSGFLKRALNPSQNCVLLYYGIKMYNMLSFRNSFYVNKMKIFLD